MVREQAKTAMPHRGAWPIAVAAVAFMAAGGALADNAATIEQGGAINRATIDQRGAEASRAVIRQDALSAGSIAYIEQTGRDNIHSIEQRSAFFGDASIAVQGIGNRGEIVQEGPGQFATAASQGDQNRFEIAQESDHGANLALVRQFGTNNESSISQNNTAPAGSGVSAALHATAQAAALVGGNLATGQLLAMVAGPVNVGAQLQAGSNNVASLDQNGQGNVAIQAQLGNGNRMTAVQNGDNNVLVHTQIGNGIVAPTIIQSGQQAVSVTQIQP